MIHTYIEIPIKLPAGVTATTDVLGNLRLRCNVRDLSPAVQEATTHALIQACDDINSAEPRKDAKTIQSLRESLNVMFDYAKNEVALGDMEPRDRITAQHDLDRAQAILQATRSQAVIDATTEPARV